MSTYECDANKACLSQHGAHSATPCLCQLKMLKKSFVVAFIAKIAKVIQDINASTHTCTHTDTRAVGLLSIACLISYFPGFYLAWTVRWPRVLRHTHTCADLKVACCSSGVNVIGKKKRSTFFESAIVLSPFSPSPASGLLVYQTLERERAPRHLKRPQRVLDPSARPATAPTLTDYQECVLMIVTMFRMYICSVFF